MYELAGAMNARGEDTIQNTPEEKLERMRDWVKKATKDFRRALSINRRIMPAYDELIRAAKLVGDDALAEETIRKAIEVDPANYYPRASLAGKYEPRWGGSFEEMDELARSVAPLVARNPRLANLKAMALAARGMPSYWSHDYAAALKEFENGLAEGPVRQYLELAEYAAGQARDSVKAVEIASQLVRFFPGDSNVRIGRANDLVQLGRYDWAEPDFRMVLREDPTNRKALQGYANLLMRRNDDDAAVHKLQELLVLEPSDAWAIGSLTWLYSHRLHRLDDAVALIDARLGQKPESGELWLLKVRLFDGVDEGPRMRDAIDNFLRHADMKSDDQRNAAAIAKRWLAAHPAQAAATAP
jgi:tetratricopeptide (TPR) repeat protein